MDEQVLNKMDVLHRNVSEALRMQPPLVMLLRMSHKAFNVTTSKGETVEIPKGHVIATSPAYQHKMDSVFPVRDTTACENAHATIVHRGIPDCRAVALQDALKYDPDRFGPGREEDKKSFSFIGFGGGRHGCMGSNFAYLQVKPSLPRSFPLVALSVLQVSSNHGSGRGPDDTPQLHVASKKQRNP